MLGQRRRPPSALSQSGSPPSATGSAGTTESPWCRLSAALTWYSPSTASREQVQKTSDPPGFSSVERVVQKAHLQARELFGLPPDFHEGQVGVTADRSGRRAGRIEQDGVVASVMLQRVADDDLGRQARPREVLAQTVEAAVRQRRAPRHPPLLPPVAGSCRPAPRTCREREGRAHSPRSRTGSAAAASCTHHAPSAKPGRAETWPASVKRRLPVGSFSAPGMVQVGVARRDVERRARLVRRLDGAQRRLAHGFADGARDPARQAAAAHVRPRSRGATFRDAAQNRVHQARDARGLCAAGLRQGDGGVHHAMSVFARHQELRRAEAQDHPHAGAGRALDETGDHLVERSHVPRTVCTSRVARAASAGSRPGSGPRWDSIRLCTTTCVSARNAARRGAMLRSVSVRRGCARGTAPPGPL
jgi:hypothetical protein